MQYPPTKKYDESGLPSALEPGDYTVRLKEIVEYDSEGNNLKDKNGNKYARFVFEVTDHEGSLLFDRFCFDESAKNANVQLGRFKQMQIAMGISTEESGSTDSLIGLRCGVFVSQREYQGKTYNDIKKYYSLNSGEAAAPKDDDDLPF